MIEFQYSWDPNTIIKKVGEALENAKFDRYLGEKSCVGLLLGNKRGHSNTIYVAELCRRVRSCISISLSGVDRNRNIMKKHLLLFLHEEYGYITQYGHSIDGISIFELFINNCSVMRYRQILEEGKYDGYGSEMTREEWSREKNEVIITRSHEYFEDDEEEFKMTFENFRKMIEDWTVLYEKQVPNIYFVFEDDGSVTVKESLDT